MDVLRNWIGAWFARHAERVSANLPARYVRVWGARGTIACGSADYMAYGGDTSCVELTWDGRTIIFDGGTGIRALGAKLAADAARLGKAIDVDLVLSHTHFDHISGLPTFAPLYNPDATVRVWLAREPGGLPLRETFEQLFATPFYPVGLSDLRADLQFHDFAQGETLSFGPDIRMETHALRHPGGATACRACCEGWDMAYVTDVEHQPGITDEALVAFLRGVDVLFYDATYTEAEYPNHEGWGHSTWQEGLRVAQSADVGQYLAFHHDPNHDDRAMARIDKAMTQADRRARAARQGMVITP